MTRIAAAFALVVLLAIPAASDTDLRAGTVSLRFDPEILGNLGIGLVDVAQTAAPLRDGALGFAVVAPASRVAFDAPSGDFESFAHADLRHAGGFALQLADAVIDLHAFRFSEAAAPRLLALRDAQGARWLVVDRPHAVLAGDRLALADADLLLAPEFAQRLGRPDLAWTYVGELDARLTFASTSAAAAPQAATAGCAGDFTQPVDLLMVDLTSMTQAAREPGGRVALAPSATVQNLGPGDVQWYRTIAPDSPVGPHPFLTMNFYRLSGGVLKQIGRSDVKHTFFATNTGCACSAGQILYAGCSDLYGVSTNLNRIQLAPRSEVHPLSATWTSLGSHFDGIPLDDVRDHGGDSVHDSFEHRLVVLEPDLQTLGARYFYDAWYLAPNDANLANSMGRREVQPAFAGGTWSFAIVDAGIARGSILDVLVDPQNVQPGQRTELADTGEGRVHLAVVTANQGGGVYHYEYALVNFDFEREIRSFSLPVVAGQTVSNPGFSDADADPANDWTASVANGRMTWTAPAGNALGWGTLFGFRMDVDAAPVEAAAVLAPRAPGNPQEIHVRTLPEPGVAASLSAFAALALLARRRAR
jgi:hypothetical protein